MASIQKKDGKIYVVYWYKDMDGKSKQKWEPCIDKSEAEFKKRQIELEKNDQTFIAPSKKTIKEFLETFVELYGTKQWGVTTYSSNIGLLENYIYPLIGKKNLQNFTTFDAEIFINKLLKTKSVNFGKRKNASEYVTPNTIKDIRKLLRCAWNQAIRYGLVKKNVFIDVILPFYKPKQREIWTIKEMQHALDLCDDPMLYLCLNLGFSCTMRISELVGLTWDCIYISDEDIENDNSRLIIDKQLLRVNKKDLERLSKDEIYKVFPNCVSRPCKSTLILKSLKMSGEERTVWIPRTVAYMLREWKKQREELKKILGSEYLDYNLVICFENGRPCDKSVIEKRFDKFITDNNLKKVVFHSLRHLSTTYKLKLNHGDLKSVQGDTGHKSPEMITKRYAHIVDEDRKINATRFEDKFYNEYSEQNSQQDDTDEVVELLGMLKENESLREELKSLLSL